jgi:hypothetical protein
MVTTRRSQVDIFLVVEGLKDGEIKEKAERGQVKSGP